jgi:hypothetical protein
MAEQTKTQGYAIALYARMEKEAEDGVWSGRLLDTIISLGIPQGGYNRAVNMLRKLDCIQQLERGFRGEQLSVFLLKRAPTPEVLAGAFVKSRDRDLTTAPSLDTLRGEVRDLREEFNKVTGGLNIVEAFANFELRLKTVEDLLQVQQVQQIQQDDNNN